MRDYRPYTHSRASETCALQSKVETTNEDTACTHLQQQKKHSSVRFAAVATPCDSYTPAEGCSSAPWAWSVLSMLPSATAYGEEKAPRGPASATKSAEPERGPLDASSPARLSSMLAMPASSASPTAPLACRRRARACPSRANSSHRSVSTRRRWACCPQWQGS